MKNIICRIFGHKQPNYKRTDCLMWCKRCKGLVGRVGTKEVAEFLEVPWIKSREEEEYEANEQTKN